MNKAHIVLDLIEGGGGFVHTLGAQWCTQQYSYNALTLDPCSSTIHPKQVGVVQARVASMAAESLLTIPRRN